MLIVAWFVALVALIVAATIATSRARSRPDEVVARPLFAIAAVGYAALVATAVWQWGGARAADDRDARLADGAHVELALRAVTIAQGSAGPPIIIGHAAAATVRLPGAGSAEVVRVEPGGVVHDGCTQTRAQVPDGASLALGCAGLTLRAAAGAISLAPLGRAPRTLVAAGDVLRIGRADVPVPALATWEVAAPTGEVIAVPLDPTSCAAWPHARPISGGCEVTAGAFTFAAIPLVPDDAAVVARATRVAIAIGAPLVLACFGFAALPRSRRRTPELSRVLVVAALGATFAALACWRMLWAYRIDMLRDLAADGVRVADNQLAAALLGATIAALVVRRAPLAVAAWLGWLAVGWFALGLGPAHLSTARIAMIGLSLCAALAPRVRRLPALPPDVYLLAIAGAAFAARLTAPRGVLGKLVLAYALVLAGHAALRAGLARASIVVRLRMVIALAIAGFAVAGYDTGVTVAIAGVGLAAAMLVAGHDAIYDDSNADKIGILEREHARLLVAHAAVAIALAIAAIAAAIIAGDGAWRARATEVACHAPLVAVALFAIAAVLARVHRRAWLPHVAAAVVALAAWSARGAVIDRVAAGHAVGSERVAVIVEPGYALLHDGARFAANASAWREAALPPASDVAAWHGEGLFGARIVDPGVIRSIETDYLPVLVAREAGVGGIVQTTLLLLAIVAAVGAFASARLGHASRAHRCRWLVAVVVGALCVYQPLASLGVLPLTGISWPGLGIDSPSDLWLFVIALAWCALGDGDGRGNDIHDERVRATRRVVRARRLAAAALALVAGAGGVIVARSAATALARVPGDDARINAALAYAAGLACPWRDRDGALGDVVPGELGGAPSDDDTARFDRELREAWRRERGAAVAAIDGGCSGRVGHWQLASEPGGDAAARCIATFRGGGPDVRLELARQPSGWKARCSLVRDDLVASALRGRDAVDHGPRIRVVGEPLGASALDAGEVIAGDRVIRLRAGAGSSSLTAPDAPAAPRAGSVAIGAATVTVTGAAITLHGDAELYTDVAGRWRRAAHAADVPIDHIALVVAGPPDARVIAQIRPAAATLLADDTDHGHRTYPRGAAVPELGWVNPYDVDHSVGLDGWIHAAIRHPAATAPACGPLAPPAIARDQVCAASPLDGVLECRVAVQPELAATLTALADRLAAAPRPVTGYDAVPTRLGFVVLRGDTGEILAQSSRVPGRPALAYAPVDRDAEAALVELREAHGESDRERAEWNLPIAVGSTLKPIVARAAELAFPHELAALVLTAAGHAGGCHAHRGTEVDPILGHCPPSSLEGDPTTADVHDFLGYSLNWFEAGLGVIGLGLPAAQMTRGDAPIALADVAATDLTSWSTRHPLQISDAAGPIVAGHSIVLAGVRRTPMWTGVEQLLGRPLCTLGDRASCERAGERADTCAARALPIAAPTRDLRYLVALGPDRLDVYADDRPAQVRVPVREYFQLLRGSGAHPIGSLAQLADAFTRVVYGDKVAASWFPAPAAGTTPSWSCGAAAARTSTVLGAGGGLCAVLHDGGTAHGALATTLADPRVVVYAAKTGTTDSLAEVAHGAASCQAWNATHEAALQLTCGKRPADDSLFVIAFGVRTPHGIVPLTLALHLQRAGLGAAARAAPGFIDAIASYLAPP